MVAEKHPFNVGDLVRCVGAKGGPGLTPCESILTDGHVYQVDFLTSAGDIILRGCEWGWSYKRFEHAEYPRVGDKVRGIPSDFGSDWLVVGKIFTVTNISNHCGQTAYILDPCPLVVSPQWYSKRFELVAHDEYEPVFQPTPADTQVIETWTNVGTGLGFSKETSLTVQNNLLQRNISEYITTISNLKEDLKHAREVKDVFVKSNIELRQKMEDTYVAQAEENIKREKLLVAQIELEREHVLRLKLALSERPLPQPPASFLEKGYTQAKTELGAIGRGVLACLGIIWRVFVSTPTNLLISGVSNFGRFWQGQWSRSWFGNTTNVNVPGYQWTMGFWHPAELVLMTPLRIAILTIPALVFVALPTYIYLDSMVWSQERYAAAFSTPTPPNPDSIKEQAWIEQRAIRLKISSPKHRRVS